VIPQAQLTRVRFEIRLRFKVLDRLLTQMVAHERHRHDQRHRAGPMLFDQIEQLLSLAAVERRLEVADDVLEDVLE
jgi:hypothetical protein